MTTGIKDEAFDPVLALNNVLGADRVRDPYPMFAQLRREAPVHPVNLSRVFGLPVYGPVDESMAADDDVSFYTALSYEAVTHVLGDGGRFSSEAYAKLMGPVMGRSILEMDEPEHGRYRALIEQAFSRREMERWEAEIISPTADALIDGFAKRGNADLVREFTLLFPIRVISGMLGLPAEDLPTFHRLAIELITVAAEPVRGIAASQQLRDYLIRIIDRRRREAQHDLISLLAHAQIEGQRLDDEEICAFLRLLLLAGAETTYRSSGNLLFGLFTHPEQLEAVREERSRIPQAIEEGLRWETPLTNIMRTATEDTEVAGVPIPAGATIDVCTGAANHDEARWERSEEFDIFRERIPHVAYGFGPHVCLGQHLARIETTVALNALFDRLPNLRLDAGADDPHIRGFVFRSPTALPVLFS